MVLTTSFALMRTYIKLKTTKTEAILRISICGGGTSVGEENQGLTCDMEGGEDQTEERTSDHF